MAPLALILDWLFAPGRRRLSWAVVPALLAFPVAWFVYTSVRAPLVYDQMKHEQVWYPYPFLDPRLADPPIVPGGMIAVVFYVAAMTAVFASAGWLTVLISRRSIGSAATSRARERKSRSAPLSQPLLAGPRHDPDRGPSAPGAAE